MSPSPLLITIIVADRAPLRAVHVGRRHELDVAHFEDARHDPEHVEDLPPAHPNVLERFLQDIKQSVSRKVRWGWVNTKVSHIELTLVMRKSTLSSKLASDDMLSDDDEDDVIPLPPPPPPTTPVVPRA